MKKLLILATAMIFSAVILTGCYEDTEDTNSIADDIVAESTAACMKTSDNGKWEESETETETETIDGIGTIEVGFTASTSSDAVFTVTFTDYKSGENILNGTLIIEVNAAINNNEVIVSGTINGEITVTGAHNVTIVYNNSSFSASIKLTPVNLSLGVEASQVNRIKVEGYSLTED